MKPEVHDLIYDTITSDDYALFMELAPRRGLREPGDHWANPIIIAPDGSPYLYRWHVVPRNDVANVYLHVQVASDPARPLHDHPYDNQSVILSGGYDEVYAEPLVHIDNDEFDFRLGSESLRILRKGDVAHRKAAEAHRLTLPPEFPYTMTLFSTGPRVKEWGFWYPDGWHDHHRHIHYENGVSTYVSGDPPSRVLP